MMRCFESLGFNIHEAGTHRGHSWCVNKQSFGVYQLCLKGLMCKLLRSQKDIVALIFEAYGLFNLLDTEQSGNIECEVGRPWSNCAGGFVQSNFLLAMVKLTKLELMTSSQDVSSLTGTVRRMFAIAGTCQCHRRGNPAVS